MGARWAAVATSRTGALLIILVTGALSALVWLSSPAQPAAEPTDGLPAGKQSTRVTELADRFPSGRTDAAVVVFERADSPLTAADKDAIAATARKLAARAQGGVVPPPTVSPDARAALLVVPVPSGLDNDADAATVDGIRATVAGPADPLPAGLTAQVTGGPAFSRDIAAAFDGADVTLLLATAGVVALLLLITYRSPVLWIVPLVVVGAADRLSAVLATHVLALTGTAWDESTVGILSVLCSVPAPTTRCC